MSDEFYERWDKEIKEIEQRDEKIHSLRSYIDPYEKTLCDIAHERGLSAKKARTYVKDGLMRLNDGKVHMARLVVVLGTKCSLRCKECNNLMPHFKPQKDLDRSVILNSLETLTAQTGSILKCELIGGEPFLSNNLKELLEYAICNPSIDSVEITTNGTVIPTEDVIPLLKKPKVLVRISDYGELVNQKSMISFLEKHKIRYISLKMESWISPGGVEKRNRDENTLQNYYQRCSSGYYCKTLYGDKLFACARAASLFALGYMKEPEFIVLNDGFQAAQLKEFMLRRLSMACDYCDMTIDNRRLVCAAEQLK
jgi:organic radical activating enzyme